MLTVMVWTFLLLYAWKYLIGAAAPRRGHLWPLFHPAVLCTPQHAGCAAARALVLSRRHYVRPRKALRCGAPRHPWTRPLAKNALQRLSPVPIF
jgi:hypothetical protein